MTTTPSVIIIPVLDNPDQSKQAVYAALRQTGVDPLAVLVIDQASGPDTRRLLEAIAQAHGESEHPVDLYLWRHAPPLPSLGATWNRALQFAWELGADDALVLNNDVELVPFYYETLRRRAQEEDLVFLSGVGVRPEQFQAFATGQVFDGGGEVQLHPDFSAFLIRRICHLAHPFDERFIPAYCEDCDYHRRLLLAGHGRAIGKINLPFLHHAAGSLKAMSPEEHRRVSEQISAGSRTHYRAKWGGDVNQERKVVPFGPDVDFPVTNDALRAVAERGGSVTEYLYEQAVQDAQIRPADVPSSQPAH